MFCISNINLKIADLYAKNKELKKEITQLEKSIEDLLKTTDASIKTTTEGLNKKITETNTKINVLKSDIGGEIKKVDKLNIFSIKVPFQFKVASIIATDQVEILGTTFDAGPSKDYFYNIRTSKCVCLIL